MVPPFHQSVSRSTKKTNTRGTAFLLLLLRDSSHPFIGSSSGSTTDTQTKAKAKAKARESPAGFVAILRRHNKMETTSRGDGKSRKVPVLRSNSNLVEQEFDSIRARFEEEMRKMETEMALFRSQLLASESHRLSQGPGLKNEDEDEDEEEESRRKQDGGGVEYKSNSRSKIISQHRTRSSTKTTKTMTSSSEANSNETVGPSSLGEPAASESPAGRGTTKLGPGGGITKTTTSTNSYAASSWLNELNSPLVVGGDGDGERILRLRFDVAPYAPEQINVRALDNRLQVHAERQEASQKGSSYSEYKREFLLPAGTDPELIRSSLSADGVLTIEAPLPFSQQQQSN